LGRKALVESLMMLAQFGAEHPYLINRFLSERDAVGLGKHILLHPYTCPSLSFEALQELGKRGYPDLPTASQVPK
jgi:hypothetical protein